MKFWKIVKSREFKIILVVLLILVIGLIELVSASYTSDTNYSNIKKQDDNLIKFYLTKLKKNSAN